MERKELKTIAHDISERIKPTLLPDKITEAGPLGTGAVPRYPEQLCKIIARPLEFCLRS